MFAIQKSQAAVEMLVILAVALIVFLFIFSLNQDTTAAVNMQLEAAKARNLVDDMAQAASLVYTQGFGAKTRIYITMPNAVNLVNISGNIILINLYAGGPMRDVYRAMDFPVNGTLSTESGSRFVDVEAKGGYVHISDNFGIG